MRSGTRVGATGMMWSWLTKLKEKKEKALTSFLTHTVEGLRAEQ